jgi:N-acetylneuraminic acid mutarotase
LLTKHVTSWDDGRVAISGASQQDTFTDRELVGFAVTTSNPACNSVINTQPTDFAINLSDAVDTSTVQASDFTVNGAPSNLPPTFANGDTQITFHYSSSPVTVEGTQTMHIPAGAFNRISDGQGNFEFNCSFCYAVTPLQITTTNPPVGGTFSPPAPGDYTYDVNFNQAVDAASVETSDLTLTGNVGGSVTNVQVMNGDTTAHFTVHFVNGGSVTASIGAGSITANGCNGNAAFSGMYTVEGFAPCSWAAGPSMPTVGTRMAGVFFPGNGKLYAMGGRSSDVGGSEFTHPYEYDPGSNSWTIKSATYPDNQVNNMACGILNQGGTDYIYCVGGSEVATQTSTGRVFRYEPITDTISTVPANWPSGDQNFVPGGFSVFNNNMFILGGFEINVAMDDNIWQFDPVALVWTHKNAHLPTQLGYIPQATIGNLIYTGGGSTYDGTLLHDSNISLVYDPVADTIGNIATIPRATAETRGLNLCNTMYVMGGGREAPNPSNEVDIYDPVANSWSVGTPFSEARRNFPTDTNGTDHIWLSGGYASDGATVLDSMEIFTCPVSPCASASPTPTATATATPTATATATPTATVRPTPTPREVPTPRPRPTPAPRP